MFILLFVLLPLIKSLRFLQQCDYFCDECRFINNTYTCIECDDFYYLNANNTCSLCSADRKCKECRGPNVCTECVANLVPVGGSCVNRKTVPNFDKNCEYYDSSYQCVECDDDCYLESNKCICPKSSHTGAIVGGVVGAIVLLAIIGVVVYFFFFRKKSNNEPQGRTTAQPVPEQEAFGKPVSGGALMGGAAMGAAAGAAVGVAVGSTHQPVYSKPNEEGNLIEASQTGENIKPKVVRPAKAKEINQKDIEKCSLCHKNFAIYKLSCGCFLCTSHSGKFEQYIKDSNRTLSETCPVCKKPVNRIKLIHRECGVCFKVKENIYSLSCACGFEVCDQCYEGVLSRGRCPGCKKDIDGNVFPLPPIEQSINEG